MSSPSTQRLPIGTSTFTHNDLSIDRLETVERFINRDLSLLEFNRRVLRFLTSFS